MIRCEAATVSDVSVEIGELPIAQTAHAAAKIARRIM
jgi:hypothetical protein